MMLLQLGIFKN